MQSLTLLGFEHRKLPVSMYAAKLIVGFVASNRPLVNVEKLCLLNYNQSYSSYFLQSLSLHVQ